MSTPVSTTKEQFLAKYGDRLVEFDQYYKYIFVYTATLPDGATLQVEYGGSPDEIYRHEVSANELVTVRSLDPSSGSVYADGKLIDMFYEH